jgi:hypothetical protein
MRRRELPESHRSMGGGDLVVDESLFGVTLHVQVNPHGSIGHFRRSQNVNPLVPDRERL